MMKAFNLLRAVLYLPCSYLTQALAAFLAKLFSMPWFWIPDL